MTRKSLAIALSRLKVFDKPKERYEQYPTDSEVAADVLHNALMLGDIEDATVLDLGAGTGILGIGALMTGAKQAIFLELDKDALVVLKENLESTGLKNKAMIKHQAVMSHEADVVIMNPPFGSKNRHADRSFIVAATGSAPVIYSIHKAETLDWLEQTAERLGYKMTHRWEYDMQLKQTLEHHRSAIHAISVVAVRLEAKAL